MQQLIKKLSATPVLAAHPSINEGGTGLQDPQASLQANKATFFFRLVSAHPITTCDR